MFWGGFLDRKALEKAETVRRKVTTGNKGGAKGFQPRTALHNEEWCIMGRFKLRGCVEYLDVREQTYRLKLPLHVANSLTNG